MEESVQKTKSECVEDNKIEIMGYIDNVSYTIDKRSCHNTGKFVFVTEDIEKIKKLIDIIQDSKSLFKNLEISTTIDKDFKSVILRVE